MIFHAMIVMMLLLPSASDDANPWKKKLPAALARANAAPSVAAVGEALQTAQRADDWQAGLRLAQLAEAKHAREPALLGLRAPALWRAGQLAGASELLSALQIEQADAEALRAIATSAAAEGDEPRADAAIRRLLTLPVATGPDHYLHAARLLSLGQVDGVGVALERAARLLSAENGYPEPHLIESIAGMPEFFRQVGAAPINQVEKHGTATLVTNAVARLLLVDVMINGRGPYRMVLDTGGSITLSLDAEVAEELELKSLASASIRGATGKEPSGQVLVESLRIGEIECRRVLTRTFPVRERVAYVADGIIGTGIFAQSRMTLDLRNMRMSLTKSASVAAKGVETPFRLIGDAKIYVDVKLSGKPATALIDSGADAIAISPTRLRELHPEREFTSISAGAMAVGQGDGLQITLTDGISFELAGRAFDRSGAVGLDVIDTQLGPILGVHTDLLLGMPALRECASWTVDFPRRTMWLEWLAPR